MSRRALQLQADEPWNSQPPYRIASIANDADPIIEPANPARSNRGRLAQAPFPPAGAMQSHHLILTNLLSPTLPSNLPILPPTTTLRFDSALPSLAATNDALPAPSTRLAPPQTSQRLRSGSLTLPAPNLANAFGPSFFSSQWQPTRSGLSHMTSATTDEEQYSPFHPSQDSTPQLSFDHADMLDYLGLDARAPSHSGPIDSDSFAHHTDHLSTDLGRHLADQGAFYSSAQLRNRSSTLGTPYAQQPPHSSLLNTALHNRLHQYSAAASSAAPLSGRAPINASRPRATSMGVLDQPQSREHPHAPYRPTPSAAAAAPGASHLTPPGSAGSSGLGVPSAAIGAYSDDLSGLLANGRNRAGTIAAFSGPGGRARAEQELLRMTQLQYEAALRREIQAQARPSSSGTLEPPTRSLWIGHLRPTVTSQELVQAFSPYGAIETFRLVPEKGCAFVNYVELADAVRAREDVVARLGGRLGLGTLGPEAQVRVGFGKPEAVPQPGLGGFTPMLDSYASSLDAAAAELGGVEAANHEPSRALWIGSIPPTTSSDVLVSVFAPFGSIESVRVLSSKSCAFINFERTEDAMTARKLLNGRDVLGPEVGAVKIGFAKVPPKPSEGYFAALDPGSAEFQAAMDMLASMSAAGPPPPQDAQMAMGQADYRANAGYDLTARQHLQPGLVGSHGLSRNQSTESSRGGAAMTYYTRIPPVQELPLGKRFDNNRLKEVRKRLETAHCQAGDADAIARDYLSCIVDLSSDFIGNTLVQKLFERCSEPMKKTMLELIAPHLATIGVHKNGTWAAQKIIDCTHADDQRAIIAHHIRPYVPPLLLDQFGNYVVQRLIPFGAPHSDFIFEAMVDRCWEVAQGRFGSRSMRVSRIATRVEPVGTEVWTAFGQSVHHKLASQTVLRLLSQKEDIEAGRQVLYRLFDSNRLEEILVDQVHGSQFVTKLVTEILEGAEKQRCAEEVQALLCGMLAAMSIGAGMEAFDPWAGEEATPAHKAVEQGFYGSNAPFY
ncbi:related to JSN1 - RNA-binding protein (pumilio family) [Moesziomyces antarcticus]|uniref:Related to JSN1 - RNA-binding protein (Pumilio family) n=1 Tax=Pseudozyma antarctica TaxID=84753 RepID=A0A5C3FYG2_PSEA2|nr:related to JSN1 - RNA-binding protein (pumilio family) [Moesziomyces antarcticus]